MRKLQGPPGPTSQNDAKQSLLVQLGTTSWIPKVSIPPHVFFFRKKTQFAQSWPNPPDFFWLFRYLIELTNPTQPQPAGQSQRIWNNHCRYAMSLRHLGVLAFDKTLQWDRWYENFWKPAQLCIEVNWQDVKFLGIFLLSPTRFFFFICIVGFLVETKTDLRYSHLSFTKAGPHHLNFHKQWKSSTSFVLKNVVLSDWIHLPKKFWVEHCKTFPTLTTEWNPLTTKSDVRIMGWPSPK